MKEIMISVKWTGHYLYDIAHERNNLLINSIYSIFYMVSHIRQKQIVKDAKNIYSEYNMIKYYKNFI